MNELAEISKKYAGCNLLMPASTEVQLNPFYKVTVMEVTADISENSGDIFKVGSIKTGKKDEKGKDIWIETFSPAKPLLMKIAAAAGIQFDPNHTYVIRESTNSYKAKAFGAMRMPDGTGKTHPDWKCINLDDEEANYRLEFMDKSIKGITDEKAAKAASEMFKGTWIDSTNKWGYPCKAYVIDDVDREKYIERSVLVNMTLLRKTAAEKAMTGAILRVIRALTGMKGQYTKEELSKPFVIPRVSFSPDYNDPTVRQAMLSQGMNAVSSLFGSTTIPAITQSETALNEESDIFNPEEFVENPAFESTAEPIEEENWFDPPKEESEPQPAPTPTSQPTPIPMPAPAPQQNAEKHNCARCSADIPENVYQYSITKFGEPLCFKCQKGVGR